MRSLLSIILCSALISGCFFDRKDEKTINLKGYNFSWADIETFCHVRRLGDTDNLVISCSDRRLQPVRQSCEGFITGGLRDTQLTCSGQLWVVKDKCVIKMREATRGEIACRI